jgi:hypothetical protein
MFVNEIVAPSDATNAARAVATIAAAAAAPIPIAAQEALLFLEAFALSSASLLRAA